MVWKVIQQVHVYNENIGRTRIIKFKLTCKYEILKLIGDLSPFDS